MNKMIQWVLAATLVCGASVFTACVSSDDNPISPDETQPSVGFSVRSLGWTEYSIDDETISDEAFEVVVPAGSSFYFKTLKVRYLDKYSGMSISEMASALILDEVEESGHMPQFVQGSQTCYGGARMNGDYVAYVFETSPDGIPTGRYAKCDFTVTESDLGAYYTGPMERRTDWTLSFVGEPYERDLYGSTHTYIDIELNAPDIQYYELEAWDDFMLGICCDKTVDGLMGILQGDYQQLLNSFSIGELLWSVGKPRESLDITDCISTDKIFLLEFDEHGKATGRYNLFALPI